MVGFDLADDAGVFRLTDDLAIIQTVDFFTPIVDDPYTFGKIAAANALSDVYAMGGKPVTAMNILCFPKKFGKDVALEILKGGFEKVHEAGAALAGGHSVDDIELKYGLSVTGIVHPNKIITNSGAKPGQALILTKPLGTGVIATGVKGDLASRESIEAMTQNMLILNKTGGESAASFGVTGGTDVTGFGLLGHGLELARASAVTLKIKAESVPFLPGAVDLASMGMVPAGTWENQNFCSKSFFAADYIKPEILSLLADAQTSGGLLLAVPVENVERYVAYLRSMDAPHTAVIGEVVEGPGTIKIV